jgi:alkanesulfonate monooxygenase SsuD/methylene tetrahydromethanopterin reductase-like flavin-dependent oxidoreductase (luciferase family)
MVSPAADDFLIEVMLPFTDGVDTGELIRLASYAEACGLDGVTCGEVLGTEAFSVLGAIAATTNRIRLDSSVVSILSRSPSLIAMAAATMASLSGGRFVLGLGAGSTLIAAAHGVPFERPVQRMATTVGFIRRALAGERLDELGGFRLAGVKPSEVPILFGAINDDMLRLAGRIADGVVLTYVGPRQLEAMATTARTDRDGSDRSGESFEVHTTLWVDASQDPEQGRQRLRAQVTNYLRLPTYRRAFVALVGSDAVDEVASAWARGGRREAMLHVPDSLLDELLLTGPAARIAARFAEYARAGCRGVRIVTINDPPSTASTVAAIELLSDVRQRWAELVPTISPR